MKYIIIIVITLFMGCKKDSTNPALTTAPPPIVTPEPVGKQVEGAWYVYDSLGVNYDDQNKKDWDTVSYHESMIFDSTHFDGQDSITRWYMSNFWGKGEVAEINQIKTDTLVFWEFPYCNAQPVISNTGRLCKANSYSYEFNQYNSAYQARGYCTIKMTKKP